MPPDSEQQIRSAVHNYFREFGYDLSETIYGELIKAGGIQRILRRLGSDDPGYPDDQYAVILNYIRRHGEEKFLSAIGQGKVDYRPTMETDTARMRELEEKQKELLKRKFLRDAGVSDAANRETSTAPPRQVLTPADKPRPPEPAPGPEPLEEGNPAVLEQQGGTSLPGTKPDGTWDGVTERRSGRDRRTGGDRRAAVEVVFKNRRFGGDRRAGKERRRNWPPAEWPPRDTRRSK